MDKYTRFHISIGIDMTVVSSSGDAAANEFSVVLEIHGINLFASCSTTDLTDSVIHIFSLFFGRKQIHSGFISNRHIMEIPGETTSFVDDHIQKFIGSNRLNIFACIANRCSEDQTVAL